MKIIKELIPYVIIIIVVATIRTFIVTPVIVNGESMDPTLENNQILILNKYEKIYERFDVIVIDYNNGDVKERLIKRIIGLPGEEIKYQEGKLYINNKEVNDSLASITKDFNISDIGNIRVPKDKYFVLGDNRNNSLDSRMLGFIDMKDIKGVTKLRLFPFTKFGEID